MTTLCVAVALVAAVSMETARVPLGGPATITDASPNAFSYPAPVLTRIERRAFAVGNSLFKDNWVAAPSSAAGRDGLGPLFNARSCSSCHFKDGRGRAPETHEREIVTGFLLRLGVDGEHGDAPHPVYGDQLQDRATRPNRAEAAFTITHETVEGRFEDGTTYELAKPVYALTNTSHGEIDSEQIRVGPRVAPQMIGLGLLEAVPDATLRALADPDDEDGDGISGRVHVVTRGDGTLAIGRFGWKATQPTVREQSAAAFAGDMGITSTLFPRENHTTAQSETIEFTSGGQPEIDDHKLGRVAFYSQTIAVPTQRNPESPIVARGERAFERIGCAACHVPTLKTGSEAVVAAYAEQEFRPYTDLLLHDLGEELADEKHDGDAAPAEWRTPPLWGVGLIETINGHTRYLHDGRARDVTEAVLWHGGEAARSRDAFRALDADEREALLAFLRSL